MPGPQLELKLIRPGTDPFSQVLRLGRKNSRTLGFLPVGAFEDHAKKQQILAASVGDQVVGYLIYRSRVRTSSIAITHLCVDETYRGSGVGAFLVARLRERTADAAGVGLWCRSDYAASRLWPRLGFVARNERPGRAGTLVYWWWRNESCPQLDLLPTELVAGQLTVALDASVFFDILDESLSPSEGHGPGEEVDSCALVADWIQPYLHLTVTAELANEISRSPDSSRRERARRFASQNFAELEISDDRFNSALTALSEVVPGRPHDSDRRQLARAASGRADIFVTRDGRLLARRASIEDAVQIQTLSPSDVVSQVDSLLRENEYRPSRVSGSLFSLKRLAGSAGAASIDSVLATGRGETKSQLRRLISECQLDRFAGAIHSVENEAGEVVGALGWKVDASLRPRHLEVKVFRCIAPKHSARTLYHAFASEVVRQAVASDCQSVSVADPHLADEAVSALSSTGFLKDGSAWSKINFGGLCASHDVLSRLLQDFGESPTASVAGRVAQLVERAIEEGRDELLDEVERLLFPLVLEDLEIPCFVVPIRPQWAVHLFDERLAAMTLFGSDPRLAFSLENVYYRSARGRVDSPARVLWYVSSDRSVPGSGAIRALSRLDQVTVGQAKQLYREFRRVGVYRWRDISRIVRGDVTGPVMAIRFSRTQLLGTPISFLDAQELLTAAGAKRNQFQSSVGAPLKFFHDLLRRAD